jgi:DNA topoisomerase-1
MVKKSLVIVESSAKARTISRYLGDRYKIEASSGHIMDLPKKELGVDVENGFEPTYVVIPDKEKILKKLKGSASRSDQIYLALDPDREGEAIAWFLVNNLGLEEERVHRVLFYEITREAVKKAIEKSGKVDQKKVNAQQARRILDRLVGYQISPVLWKKVKPKLSAGRVQTVALRLICEREKEISSFVAEEFWSIHAHLLTEKENGFEAKLVKIKGEDPSIPDAEVADRIIQDIGEGPFVIGKIDLKSRKKNPNPPFITSTLQQEASRRLGLPASRTMSIAQSLYEGIDLERERRAGLITYMRTDSVRMASSAVGEARSYIREHFGKEFLPEKPRGFKSKRRVQDAHEAIRPTSVKRTPESIKKYLDKDQFRLYDLIWRRFLACQMSSAVYDLTVVDMPVGDYLFRANGSILRFPGYQELMGTDRTRKGENNGDDVILPELREGEELFLEELEPKQHFTQPPPRYTEGSLIKELESQDIGRPSTYASIVRTLKDRHYITVEKKKFVPVDLGKVVNEALTGSFPIIFEVEFTRHMEASLDRVENGEIGWKDVLKEFYVPFSRSLQGAENKIGQILEEKLKNLTDPEDWICEKCGNKMTIKWKKDEALLGCSKYPECRNIRPLFPPKEPVTVDEKCPKCQSPLQVKRGRFGQFIGCTAYPKCSYTRKLEGEEESEKTESSPREEKCNICGSEMVLKSGRFGRFLSCTKYPDCKGTRSLTIDVPCPEEDCDGELVERKGKGRVFYGCSNYPKCKFTSWSKPQSQACPSCNYQFSTVAGKRKPEQYKCLKCGKVFVSGEEVSAHSQ